MNFFENQEHARAQTRKLIFLYTLAVLATALVIALAVTFGFYNNTQESGSIDPSMIIYDPIFLITFASVTAFILICSIFKIITLAGGGKKIAEMVGAVPVDSTTNDPAIKKYINVVQEMALAAGTPVPTIYLMDGEQSINAFAAGYEVDDAVVAVSRGAIDQLTRDELQGVVAHEFSHILNGDMKLNIKLMGYIFGLSALVEIGNILLRSRSRNSRSKGSSSAGLGLILCLCGMVGMLFASLIKAAISRQREFLADASAVQFTRNPNGIGGALKKILTLEAGSLITLPRASEIGHLFFGEAVRNFFTFFATHPPLTERIKAIDEHLLEGIKIEQAPQNQRSMSSGIASLTNSVGTMSASSVNAAEKLLKSIPETIRSLYQTADSAPILCLSLFVATKDEGRKQQEQSFEKRPQLWRLIDDAQTKMNSLAEKLRLPIVNLCLPVLKTLDSEKQDAFLQDCKQLIQADGKLSAQEFILYQLLWQSLKGGHGFFDKKIKPNDLKSDCAYILSFLLHVGKTTDAENIFKVVMTDLYGETVPMPEITSATLAEITKSFARLRAAHTLFKKNFFLACQKITQADERITPLEYEFLRLVSAILLIPLPALEVSD